MDWLQLAVLAPRTCLSLLTFGGRVRAQSTVEYALVGALVVIAAATALTLLGDQVNAVFGNITTTLKGTVK
jgi:Flp pilus assembly pilin Flp